MQRLLVLCRPSKITASYGSRNFFRHRGSKSSQPSRGLASAAQHQGQAQENFVAPPSNFSATATPTQTPPAAKQTKHVIKSKPAVSEGEFVTGISHAGHSAVLGPVVVASVTFDAKGAKALLEAGIGRHVPVAKRDAMYDLIIQHAKVCKVAEISSEKFNDLTEIEKIKADTIISKQYHDLADDLVANHKSSIGTVYVRSGPSRPFEMLKEAFSKDFPVSDDAGWLEQAAFIVARTRRDRLFETIKNVHKEQAGSGFAHDFRTREWLRIHMKRKRTNHPVNMIRYSGWSEKNLIEDWRLIEEKRWQEQKQAHFAKYPELLNDPVRLTGSFEQYRAMEAELRARMRELQGTERDLKKAAKTARKEKRASREQKRKTERNALLKVYTSGTSSDKAS